MTHGFTKGVSVYVLYLQINDFWAESVLLSIRLYGQSGSHGFLKSLITCLVFKLSGQASLTAVSAWPIFISMLIALLPEPLSNSHPAQGPIPWNFTDP